MSSSPQTRPTEFDAASEFDDGDRFLTEAECKRESGLSKSTRDRMRKIGKFPPLIPLSPNVKRNTLGQVRTWKAERFAEAEAQPPQNRRGRPRKAKPNNQIAAE